MYPWTGFLWRPALLLMNAKLCGLGQIKLKGKKIIQLFVWGKGWVGVMASVVEVWTTISKWVSSNPITKTVGSNPFFMGHLSSQNWRIQGLINGTPILRKSIWLKTTGANTGAKNRRIVNWIWALKVVLSSRSLKPSMLIWSGLTRLPMKLSSETQYC